jgi:putative peptidoglycan lipid II flippase
MGRALGGIRISLGRGVSGVREAVRNLVPVVAARGAVNLSAYVDVILAGLLVAGAVGHLGRAQTLYILPISLFGMAVAAAELPELSREGAQAGAALAERVRAALARVRFLLIPSAAAYLVFGDLLVAGLYQRGEFGAVDSSVVAWVLAAYALGLPASGSSRTLSSAFYALRDTRTPARIAGLRIVVSLSVALLLIFPLDRVRLGPYGLGAAGLALGASAAAWLEYGLLRRRLTERIGVHGPGWRGLALLLAAAVLAGVAAWATRRFLIPAAVPDTLAFLGSDVALLVQAVGTAAVFGVVYLTLAGAAGQGIPLVRRRSSP